MYIISTFYTVYNGKTWRFGELFKIANIKAKRWTHVVAMPKTLNLKTPKAFSPNIILASHYTV